MYNFMVLNNPKEKAPKDFMSYYKRSKDDDFYFVSINHPDVLKPLEDYIDRSIN